MIPPEKNGKKTAVIGAGALGAVYAEKIFALDRNSISFIAEGARYDRLKKSGVIVNGEPCPIAVVKPEDINKPFDLVIVAVKHHHLPEAIKDIRQAVGENTRILSIMNCTSGQEFRQSPLAVRPLGALNLKRLRAGEWMATSL